MSDKKSLGSSPIGFSALGTSSFQFIPDRRVSRTESSSIRGYDSSDAEESSGGSKASVHLHKKQTPEKKITSYYLEVELIHRLKAMADDQDTYYSTLANEAIRHWVDIHGY